ncbi:DRTGG domain-containing protein [Natranaerovirga pectinivora]|uniref:DRTGG domain-containing protein n=1 Tax=Natranaerovirga pectinivora TaxID=682400 RepID=A0A4R3MMB4_9FIRM|nr:DRTGG domain-containing protein [Natranaerovirga pectinivora]TCT14985.1 DRTGG domain-containing protein [Natranaerovirga pectinivora]
MLLKEVKEYLDATVLTGEEMLMESIDYGYGCDLMSDVLAFVSNNVLLLTGLTHPQVIRTADILDIKAIVIVRGKKVDDEFISMAKRKEIVVLATRHSLFSACGILFEKGLLGEEIAHNDFSL